MSDSVEQNVNIHSRPSDLRIIGSSNQFSHEYNGRESWTNFPFERQRMIGLIRRTELAINLATALSRQGIVIRSDYMHLTRSLTAMVGSFLGIYKGVPRRILIQDIAQVIVQFPALEGMRQLGGFRKRLLRQISPMSAMPTPRELQST